MAAFWVLRVVMKGEERWNQSTWKNCPKDFNKQWYWMWSCLFAVILLLALQLAELSLGYGLSTHEMEFLFVKPKEEGMSSSFLASPEWTEKKQLHDIEPRLKIQ